MLQYDGQALTEGILTNVFNRVLVWFKNQMVKIIKWVTQNTEKLISFFGVEPNVDVKENITWPY